MQSSITFNSCRTVDLPLIKPYCLVLKYELPILLFADIVVVVYFSTPVE